MLDGAVDTPVDVGNAVADARVDDAPAADVFDSGRGDASPADGGNLATPRCETVSFMHDGVNRAYILCTPNPVPAGALPVVLGFHGGGGNAASWQRVLPWHETGAREGFVVVFMQGCQPGAVDCTGATGSYGWNVGKPGETTMVDDQGFTLAVLGRLTTVHALSIDRARVFATGHSLGGIFTYTLRCDRPDVFAAIGPISATPSDATCILAWNTSIYHVHGTGDMNVPFDTGCCSRAQQTMGDPEYLAGCAALPRCFNPTNWWPPARTGMHPFADFIGIEEIARDGLGCATTRTPIAGLPACEQYGGCRAGTHVEECHVRGADHALAGINMLFDVRAYLWGRFRMH